MHSGALSESVVGGYENAIAPGLGREADGARAISGGNGCMLER